VRIFKLGLVGLAVIGACMVGIAVAHTKYFTTTMVARFDPEGTGGTYSGRVVSPKQACEASRKVTITDNREHVLGQGSSNSKGDFSFHGRTPPASGAVEAEAKIKRIKPRTRRHKHYCLTGRTHVAVHR
jgi:hypothetical protein